MTQKILILLTTITSIFIPIYPFFYLIGMFVLADAIFGIIKSKKNKVKIKSDRLFQGIAIKTLIYLSVILMFFLTETFLLNEFIHNYFNIDFIITKMMTLFFIGIEVYSIDENIREFNNEKGFKYYFTRIITNFKNYIKELKDFKDRFNELGDKKK